MNSLLIFFHRCNLLLLGLPGWLPGLAESKKARSRVVMAVEEFEQALGAVADGRDPGSKWNDMSDVSQIMIDRATGWRKGKASVRLSAVADTVLLWAMNVNSNGVIFWMLWHVYSQPDLLARIRNEIDSLVRSSVPKSEFPVVEAPRLSMDSDGLLRSCPLLKATYFETLRMNVPSASYCKIVKDFTVEESTEDAVIAGRKEPQGYRLRRGDLVWTNEPDHDSIVLIYTGFHSEWSASKRSTVLDEPSSLRAGTFLSGRREGFIQSQGRHEDVESFWWRFDDVQRYFSFLDSCPRQNISALERPPVPFFWS